MTTYTLRNANPARTRVDAVVVGVVSTSKGPALAPGAEEITLAYARRLRPLLSTLGITGKEGETAKVPTDDTVGSPLMVLVGMGPADKLTPSGVRRAAGLAARTVSNAATVGLALPADTPELVRAVVEGHVLGGYRFETYKSETRSEAATAPEVVVLTTIARQPAATEALLRARVIAGAAIRVRDWVNTPAADLDPATFAEAVEAEHAALTSGKDAPAVELEIWDADQLAEEGCGGILAVGSGSDVPPRLVKMTWAPEGATKHVALVGKGITFDTGGYWIKPGSSMSWMKCDMAGAASVLSALLAIAELRIPVKVTAWAPMAENMVSGSAMRPGDVMTARNGSTVEIINTDAEGRLVLCDALALAVEEEPDAVVDIATLTGAMMMALGDKITGVVGDDEVVAGLLAAGDSAGERGWQMPIPAEMRDRVRSSKVADLAHYDGVRWGGGLFAAAFLREFTADVPWGHLDVAGPAYNNGGASGHLTPGGTGNGVATLIDFVAAQA